MRFPDAVSIVRPDPDAPDAYGNPGWAAPIAARAFLTREAAMFPPGTAIGEGDRLITARGLFVVDGDPGAPHNPAGRLVPMHVKLIRLPDGA